MDDCYSCGEEQPRYECLKTERTCGHHCNCSWTQSVCHWCGQEFGEVNAPTKENNEFKCAACYGTFSKVWTDEEATSEMASIFGTVAVEERTVICHDCWLKMELGDTDD